MTRSVCVMQPRLLPHLGYFALMRRVDTFVLFDSAQYVRREWINRNRIREAGAKEGWRWLQVPVAKAPRTTAIRAIEVAYDPPWQERLRRTLRHTYGQAPQFDQVLPWVDPLWRRPRLLVDLLVPLLERFAAALGLAPEWLRASDLEGAVVPDDPQERVLAICEQLGATTYWNLPGGRALYRPDAFRKAGIALRFVPEIDESALRRDFAEASLLSILDIAMYHAPDKIRGMIERIHDGR